MARGRSLAEFQKAFADEASCATFLFKRCWPAGFVCPACGKRRASSSSSLVSSGSARGASSSRSPQPVPTPTNGGWPPPASSQPPRRDAEKTRQSNPPPTGDPQKTDPIRANRARDAFVLATATAQSPSGRPSPSYEKCALDCPAA